MAVCFTNARQLPVLPVVACKVERGWIGGGVGAVMIGVMPGALELKRGLDTVL